MAFRAEVIAASKSTGSAQPVSSAADITQRPLRVLHVIPSVSLSHGGPSYAIRSIETALGRLGIQVETATTTDAGQGHRLSRTTATRLLEDDAHRWYFTKRTEFYKVAPGFALWMIGRVHQYDVVHIHALFSFTSTVAAWMARARGVPYVVRPLGVLAPYGMSRRRPWLKRLSFKLVEAPILRHAAAIHFTSAAERDEALDLGVAFRSAVIPLAVAANTTGGQASRALSLLTPPATGLRVLFLSRLDPKKNLEGLIRAVALLTRDGAQMTVLIAGAGTPAYTAQLHSLAITERVSEHIRWLGNVDGAAKADLFAAADVFVLPSHSENFGIAVAEALASGLPCVVGRGVALAQQVQQAGAGLATDPDPLSISKAIAALLGSPTQRLAMSQAARRLAHDEFSAATMAIRLATLYEDLCGATPAPGRRATR